MGPSSADDGEKGFDDLGECVAVASMGPSSADDGEAACVAAESAMRQASMGPSSADDGEAEGASGIRWRCTRFNGAVIS